MVTISGYEDHELVLEMQSWGLVSILELQTL